MGRGLVVSRFRDRAVYLLGLRAVSLLGLRAVSLLQSRHAHVTKVARQYQTYVCSNADRSIDSANGAQHRFAAMLSTVKSPQADTHLTESRQRLTTHLTDVYNNKVAGAVTPSAPRTDQGATPCMIP